MSDGIDWAALRAEGIGDFAAAALPPTLKMPALPLAVTKFVEAAGRPDVAVKELAGIIQTDTGLTTELLRHVNSASQGLRQKASSAVQAMALLGVRPAKTFVLATGVQAAVRAKQSRLINQACFWNASLQKALFAREVAVLLKADPEVAFAGGLLQDFLLPVVSNELFDDYLAFAGRPPEESSRLCDLERSRFGWDHATGAASLAHRWHLPDDLVCCVLYHHLGLRALAHPVLKRTPAAAVAISSLLPDQLRQDPTGLQQLVLLGRKWPAFDLRAIVGRVDERHAATGLGVANDFPLSRRCAAALDGDGTGPAYAAAFRDGSLNRVAMAS